VTGARRYREWGGGAVNSLYEPERHEPLCDDAWDETRVRAEISEIAALAEAGFDGARLWPTHPLDFERPPTRSPIGLYVGAAGVIYALHALAQRGIVSLRRDWQAPAISLIESYPHDPLVGRRHPGLLLGESGVAFVAHALRPSPQLIERLLRCIAENFDAAEDELMWGAPGTLALARQLFDRTGDVRLQEMFRAGASRLLARLLEVPDAGCRLWLQDLYGAKSYLLGAVHGFVGNVAGLACGLDWLAREERETLIAQVPRTLAATAERADGVCGWPQSVVLHRPKRVARLVQICHGAPGVVCALRDVPVGVSSTLERLLVEAGELTWRAGPLRKGPGLCHGTAGNGYAFLELHRRTGDAFWLERARRFAMHALVQTRAHRSAYGHARFTLWTGDPGIALYLADCIRGDGGVPTLSAW
jgi:hypothetical protein